MKTILKIMNKTLIFVLILSALIMILTIIYTVVDLSNNYTLNFSSKLYVENFVNSFEWCKSILGGTFALFTVFYAFQTFKVHNENRLFNNYIAPRGERINKYLKSIETTNKQLHIFISCYHREIIRKIISNEDDNNIKNKSKLQSYFDKYVKQYVDKFEHSGHYGTKCQGNCSICTYCKEMPRYINNQFENFKLFAFDLFCISIEYSDFETDIMDIYTKALERN